MKKLIMTTAIILALSMTSFADGGGLFNRADNAKNGGDAYSYYQGNRGSGIKLDAEDFPGLPSHGLETHQNAPLGSGIAVLTALGAAYLVGKRRKKD